MTVDIADLEMCHFTGTQACAVSGGQCHFVLEAGRRLQQPFYLVGIQDDGQFARLEHSTHLA